jgi:hypothetical protein
VEALSGFDAYQWRSMKMELELHPLGSSDRRHLLTFGGLTLEHNGISPDLPYVLLGKMSCSNG